MLNAMLKEVILQRRETHPSSSVSNIGDGIRHATLQNGEGLQPKSFWRPRVPSVNKLTTDLNGKPVKPQWVVEAWANFNGPGDSNGAHYNPASLWSTSYCVDDGGCGGDTSLGGEFEMLDPAAQLP